MHLMSKSGIMQSRVFVFSRSNHWGEWWKVRKKCRQCHVWIRTGLGFLSRIGSVWLVFGFGVFFVGGGACVSVSVTKDLHTCFWLLVQMVSAVLLSLSPCEVTSALSAKTTSAFFVTKTTTNTTTIGTPLTFIASLCAREFAENCNFSSKQQFANECFCYVF